MSDKPMLAFDHHHLVGLSVNWEMAITIRHMMVVVDGKVPTKEQVAEMQADFDEGIEARRKCPEHIMAVWKNEET